MSEKIIPRAELTAEKLRELLHYDPETGVFTRKVTTSSVAMKGEVAGNLASTGYLQLMVARTMYNAHRLAWLYVYGEWPKGQIDHIDRDRVNNRISNLRDATPKQNQQNRSKDHNNTSGHVGVRRHKNRPNWYVQIRHNYELIHLGTFEKLEDAVAARKAGELKYWGVNRSE